MRTINRVLIGVAILFGVLVAVVAIQPADFTVQRSETIAAPADVVFPLVNDFHNWTAWSPWERSDPNMKRTIEGSSAGPGAVYKWESDRIGSGRMTITDARPNELVHIKLEFLRPFPATDTAVFTLAPMEDERTKVTWKMSGHKDWLGKAAGLVMNFDKTIGGDFEKGLRSMKQLAENQAKKPAAPVM